MFSLSLCADNIVFRWYKVRFRWLNGNRFEKALLYRLPVCSQCDVFFYNFNSFTLCEDRTLVLIVPAFDNCFISLFRVEYQLKSFKWMKEL